MSIYFTQFRQFLAKYGYIETDIDQLVDLCTVVEFTKGDTIIKAGVIQSHIYFICKGIVRNYFFSEDGQICTNAFRMENMTSTGYSNYNRAENLKAKVSVECLEDCVMIQVPLNAVKYMLENCNNGEKVSWRI